MRQIFLFPQVPEFKSRAKRYMDLSSVVPSSDPRSRLENSQLVRLQPVGILNFVIFRYVPIRGEDNLVFFL